MVLKSRIALSGLAATGALETGFLSFAKLQPLSNSMIDTFCTDTSCNSVLSGPYSNIPVLDIPLVSVAFVAYTAVAALSLYPVLQNADANSTKTEKFHASSELVLFLTFAMATFSGYLMTLLTLVLQSSCNYCFLSAFLSVSMALVAWNSKLVQNTAKAFAIAATSTATTAVTSGFLFYFTSITAVPEAVQASTAPAAQVLEKMAQAEAQEKKQAPTISTSSSKRALDLSLKLKELDAKMYGAYWCSHCYNQKQIFGKEAYANIEYLECDKEGFNSQYSTCRAKKIPGYPTWEIGGEFFPGEKDLSEIEKIVIPKLSKSD